MPCSPAVVGVVGVASAVTAASGGGTCVSVACVCGVVAAVDVGSITAADMGVPTSFASLVAVLVGWGCSCGCGVAGTAAVGVGKGGDVTTGAVSVMGVGMGVMWR